MRRLESLRRDLMTNSKSLKMIWLYLSSLMNLKRKDSKEEQMMKKLSSKRIITIW